MIRMIDRSLLPALCLVAAGLLTVALSTQAAEPNFSQVPGTVIDHVPASSGMYVGSPSIAVLPDGALVASHDLFGPRTAEHEAATTRVFRSDDRGNTWRQVAVVRPAFWSNLFVHGGKLYLMGPTAHHGNLVIRRSDDGGTTWTEPTDSQHGLLAEGQYHTAPCPMLIHDGRIWRAIEDATNGRQWGSRYSPMVFSAPVDADLLDAASWTHTNYIKIDPAWLGGQFNAWLEGNVVATPDGHVVDILRMHRGNLGGKAAVVRISDDGKVASFDPEKDLIDFPGGAKKFTIRYDPDSRAYWALVNPALPRHINDTGAAGLRNALALMKSEDLKTWEMRCILMYHPDVRHHGFQYPDWVFDGDDMLAAIRTGYDDGLDGAHNAHDANFLTFRRVSNFRTLTMADSVIAQDQVTEPATMRIEREDVTIRGQGIEDATLEDGGIAFGNRKYVWAGVPRRFAGWRYTQTRGGGKRHIEVVAHRQITLYMATEASGKDIDLSGWQPVDGARFTYSDGGKTELAVFERPVEAGRKLAIPQGNWTGGLLLYPPHAATPRRDAEGTTP